MCIKFCVFCISSSPCLSFKASCKLHNYASGNGRKCLYSVLKIVVFLIVFLPYCSLLAQLPETREEILEIGFGFRSDCLDWKTSFKGDSKCTLHSHLKWHELQICQIEARGQYVTSKNIYFRGSADYGWIIAGKNSDLDWGKRFPYSSYCSEGLRFEIAHSHSKTNGHAYDVKVAVGYRFQIVEKIFSIAPLVGYSLHGQKFQDHHLRQRFYGEMESGMSSVMDRSDSIASNIGTNAEYHAHWRGVFLGFDFDCNFSRSGSTVEWGSFGTYEFHWSGYYGKGQWNFRQDFVDGCFYHHAKNAYGNVLNLGLKWNFCGKWSLALRSEFQWFWASSGGHKVKISHDSFKKKTTDCFFLLDLHSIRWQSASLIIDLGIIF